MSEINDGGPLVERFWRFVADFGGDSSKCWNWLGAKTRKGYGVFTIKKPMMVRAHRFAFLLHYGREPGAMVLHSCDNPSCVNPLHLSEGTHGENMRQMAARKRAAREERHHKAKLIFNEALAINLLHQSGDYSTRELASLFNMSQPTIAALTKGDLWPDAKIAADAMLKAREVRQ